MLDISSRLLRPFKYETANGEINEVSAVFILQWQIWTIFMYHEKQRTFKLKA